MGPKTRRIAALERQKAELTEQLATKDALIARLRGLVQEWRADHEEITVQGFGHLAIDGGQYCDVCEDPWPCDIAQRIDAALDAAQLTTATDRAESAEARLAAALAVIGTHLTHGFSDGPGHPILKRCSVCYGLPDEKPPHRPDCPVGALVSRKRLLAEVAEI